LGLIGARDQLQLKRRIYRYIPNLALLGPIRTETNYGYGRSRASCIVSPRLI
jgi:hypothetical protein